jgi:hypothetical protein
MDGVGPASADVVPLGSAARFVSVDSVDPAKRKRRARFCELRLLPTLWGVVWLWCGRGAGA